MAEQETIQDRFTRRVEEAKAWSRKHCQECPACGSRAFVVNEAEHTRTGYVSRWHVACTYCSLTSRPRLTGETETETDCVMAVIDEWNNVPARYRGR